jgi:type II secretory pathway pseudopilin PulG
MIDLVVSIGILLVLIAAVGLGAVSAIGTYQRNAVARKVLAEIRAAQSQAVTRGAVIGLHWGADPLVNRPASEYRVVRDTNGSCSLPADTAPEDGTNVIHTWRSLADDFPDARILSIRDAGNQDLNGVMFNSMGAAVNTCTSVNFPITVRVADASGQSHSIEILGAGGVRLQ